MQKTRKQEVHGSQQSTLVSRPLQENFKAQKKGARGDNIPATGGERPHRPQARRRTWLRGGVLNTQTMDAGEGQEDWWDEWGRRRQRVRWRCGCGAVAARRGDALIRSMHRRGQPPPPLAVGATGRPRRALVGPSRGAEM